MGFIKELHLEGHSSPILSLSSSHVPGYQQIVASGSEGGQVCLHDVIETRLTHKLNLGNEDDAVSSLTFHPTDPNQLFAAVASEIKVIDLRAGPGVACTFNPNKDEVNQVAINAKGTHLAAADDAGDVQVLDLTSGKLFKSIQGAHSNIASAVSFRAHRPWELVTAGFDQTVARWDFSRGKCLARMRMEVEAKVEGESQLFNPPMVHALAVPSTSTRPWCQVVAAARGDGTVEVFDADMAQLSNSSAATKQGKARVATRPQNTGMAASTNAVSSSGGRLGESRSSESWQGPLALDRAHGGHTRPATTACFLGDASAAAEGGSELASSGQEGRSAEGPGSSCSSVSAKAGKSRYCKQQVQRGGSAAVGTGVPTHVLSGSEDRRLLLWRLPNLSSVQGGTEWVPQDDDGNVCANDEVIQGMMAFGGCEGGRAIKVAKQDHGRKVNCLHCLPPAQHLGASQRQLVYVGDTSKRLSCYRVELT